MDPRSPSRAAAVDKDGAGKEVRYLQCAYAVPVTSERATLYYGFTICIMLMYECAARGADGERRSLMIDAQRDIPQEAPVAAPRRAGNAADAETSRRTIKRARR